MKPTRAQASDFCDLCAYPFDLGQQALEDEAGRIFCTRECATMHDALLHQDRQNRRGLHRARREAEGG